MHRKAITTFIQNYIPNALLISETQHELSYILPDKGKEKKSMLGNLFAKLEEEKDRLSFLSYGLLDTTLEEVNCFLSI